MPSDFGVSNPLSQVGDRSSAFEVPFRGHVSHVVLLISLETVIGSKQLKTETNIAGFNCTFIIVPPLYNFNWQL